MCLSIFVCPLKANQDIYSTSGAQDIKIKIINVPNMDFVHAELAIFYKNSNVNPAIRHLTTLNIFNEDVNQGGSGLLSTLRKLGNDFEVFNRQDYLLLKINFLRDKLPIFGQFLKGLYSYKAFSLKKFTYSVSNFRNLFFKHDDWKRETAFQVAYQKLFPDQPLGNALIVPGSVTKINLAQIRSFYQRTYTLSNSLLIIKGNLKTGIVLGSINRVFKQLKKQEIKKRYLKEKLKINGGREVIIYHINSSSPPEIYWFETIPPLNRKNHIPLRVLNDMLFSQPTGRLSRVNNGVRFSRVHTEVLNHEEVSVICNNVRINFSNIEKFILFVDTEKRKLKNINRREYLDVKNYFCGRLKVNSRKVENDVELERDFSLFKSEESRLLSSFVRISQQVTYESLSSVSQDLAGGTIVIVGNANLIVRHLSTLKPKIIRYIE
ncbi:insulinase family protein [Acidobacteriota bacterium]